MCKFLLSKKRNQKQEANDFNSCRETTSGIGLRRYRKYKRSSEGNQGKFFHKGSLWGHKSNKDIQYSDLLHAFIAFDNIFIYKINQFFSTGIGFLKKRN